MIECIQLLRNIGQFDSVDAGAILPLKKLTLVYAENGRGKTTLAAVLRSLGTGDPVPILERRQLAAHHPPLVVLTGSGGGTAIFQRGSWSRILPEIVVFDDLFVADNVCSGVDIDPEHRQHLHEFILGAQGVALSEVLQGHIASIEEHIRALRARSDAIPAAVRGALTVDAFCALERRADIEQAIEEAERDLAAGHAADALRRAPAFETLALPEFDVAAIVALLRRDLPELGAGAAARVRAHLASLGAGGEAWVGDGMHRVGRASADRDGEICPFCAQDLDGSAVIALYRTYFSDAYENLKEAITQGLTSLTAAHSGEAIAAFERAVRVAVQRRQFWAEFTEVPDLGLDTAAIVRARQAALEAIVMVLRAKLATPLEQLTLSAEASAAVEAYHKQRDAVGGLNGSLETVNAQIAIVKEKAASANVATLAADLTRLKAIKARYSPEIAPLCADFLTEKAAKTSTETSRDEARAALYQYRQAVFPAYEIVINDYLRRFNAGFRLSRMNSINTRGGSTCGYYILINNQEVPITSDGDLGPSFRNTLSAGDRNTLALAFFFASLDRNLKQNRKIVVIDDPLTSLDEHRSLTTVQEMRRVVATVEQVIVLSHSKSFLCTLWEGADTDVRTAIKITRDGAGSTLALWDVSQDCITEHDRRHNLVRHYLRTSNAADERAVAVALRPILESYIRVAYPEQFPPGSLLGPFRRTCEQKSGTREQILSPKDITELRELLEYANRFHHDTNAAWETATVNDGELKHFSERVLSFTRRQ